MRMPPFILFTLLAPALALSAPRIPVNPEEVLEVLPPRRIALQAASPGEQVPAASAVATTLALLQTAQREGDPRYLGQAAALLARLPTTSEVRLLRARLHQANHRFGEALVELHQVLQRYPRHTEALLLQASIYQVRGDYALARQSCDRITDPDALILALACRAQLDGLTGNGRQALSQLEKLSALGNGLSDDQNTWIQLATGDLALRMDHQQVAGAAYRRVMHNSRDALAAYTDWLLHNERPAEAAALLRPYTQHDGLLLRLAIAEKQLGLPSAQVHRQSLAARFKSLSTRGDNDHLREEAMFTLEILGDNAQALTLARRNWDQQREPADLLLYRKAALASNSLRDLRRISEWQQRHRLQDVRLAMEIPSS